VPCNFTYDEKDVFKTFDDIPESSNSVFDTRLTDNTTLRETLVKPTGEGFYCDDEHEDDYEEVM
jgi:hypothetical protein